jgi:DnaJ-class molecular chaperone
LPQRYLFKILQTGQAPKMERPRTSYRDYYYILGLTVGASHAQIQAAYNELHDKFGPHVGAEELDPDAMAKAFRDISEAYEVLMDPHKRKEYDKKAYENKQVSNDLRDLWLKKSGLNAAEAAAAQAAEEHNPSSWIKRTTTGNHPIYEDDKNQTNAQRTSSARNPAFNPTASSQRNPVFNPTASSPRNPVFNPTASSQSNPVFNPTASSQRNPVYNPTASANNPTFNPADDNTYGQEYQTEQQYGGVDPNGQGSNQVEGYGTAGQDSSHGNSSYATTINNGYDYQSNDGVQVSNHSPALSLELDLTVTLKEAFKGTTREIVITDPVACHECSNMKPVLRMQCHQCRGVGTYNVDRKEEIVLPAGMYDGMEISKPGQGRYDMRLGRNGDLIMKIKLARHALLGVSGRDVTCTVPVTIYEAMLGAEIQAPCATGKVTLKIQPLTQPGRVYRLKGMGLCGADQLVTIEVVLPSRLSGDEVAMYKKLRDSFQEPNPRDKFFQQS